MTSTRVICVLGMHRSGTSLVTRVLNLLGVYLGPEAHLLPAAADNPAGFWEHRQLMELHEALLARFRGTWGDPPSFPPDWAGARELEDLRDRARAVIGGDFCGADIWGWKDPRTCLTLPFWQHLLPPMRYVLCFRDPADVVQSLQRRDGFSAAKSVHLWLVYARSAVAHTAGQPQCIACYEDMLDDWLAETRRLAAFIGMPTRSEDPQIQKAVAQFLDKDLRHHHSAAPAARRLALPSPVEQALDLARQVYRGVRTAKQIPPAGDHTLETALAVIEPELRREKRQEEDAWRRQAQNANDELQSLLGRPETFILVDQDEIRHAMPAGLHALPFLEHDGQYWGPPANDGIAVRELDRLRRRGAAFLAFAWPAFWWLDYYEGFHRHLLASFQTVLANDRLVVFDLRSA